MKTRIRSTIGVVMLAFLIFAIIAWSGGGP